MLLVKNLSIFSKPEGEPVVSELSLSLKPESKVFLDCDDESVIELIFLAIAGVLSHVYPEYEATSDEIRLNDTPISKMMEKVKLNIGNAYAQISGIFEETNDEVQLFRKNSRILRTADFNSLKNKSVFYLSGGELQRLMLLRSMVSRPGLWLCQNQLSELDSKNRKRLLDRVNEMTGILLMHDWFEEEILDYFTDFYSLQRSSTNTFQAFNKIDPSYLLERGASRAVKIERRPNRKTSISIQDLDFSFGDFKLFSKKNLSFYEGLNFFIGSNGSGKTTVFNILTGVINSREFQGEIQIKGHSLRDYFDRRPIGITFQNPELSLFYPTVLSELKIGLKENTEMIQEGLKILGLSNQLNSDLSSVPYRVKKKLTVLSTLNLNPEIILFDEPTQSLNSQDKTQIVTFIKYILDKGKTVICTTHSKNFITSFNSVDYSIVHI